MSRTSFFILVIIFPMLVHAGHFFAEPSVAVGFSNISPIISVNMDQGANTPYRQLTSKHTVSQLGGALKLGFCFNGARERYAVGMEYLTLSPTNTQIKALSEYTDTFFTMKVVADAVLYNFQFNYLVSPKWVINLETGIGPGFIHSRGTLSSAGQKDEQQQSSQTIVWQLGVGGAYRITNKLSWTFSADYVDWGNLQLGKNYFRSESTVPRVPGMYLYSDDFSSTMLMTGLRVYF